MYRANGKRWRLLSSINSSLVTGTGRHEKPSRALSNYRMWTDQYKLVGRLNEFRGFDNKSSKKLRKKMKNRIKIQIASRTRTGIMRNLILKILI